MSRPITRGLSVTRLRLYLGGLLIAVLIPTAVLIQQTQRQLRWEAFHQYRTLAADWTARVDRRLREAIAAEEARSSADYQYLVTAAPDEATYLQLSPLAAYPIASPLPGLMGYFQIDADGAFTTPLLPTDPRGIAVTDLDARLAVQEQLLDILSRNSLVARSLDTKIAEEFESGVDEDDALMADAPYATRSTTPRESIAEQATGSRAISDERASGQVAFDRLSQKSAEPQRRDQASRANNRANELREKKDADFAPGKQEAAQPAAAAAEIGGVTKGSARTRRKEQTSVLVSPSSPRIELFESELDPFELALLESGHFVLFRKVWRDGRRRIQGTLIEPQAFIDSALGQPFVDSPLSSGATLMVAYRERALREFAGAGSTRGVLAGESLHRARLSAPLSDIELILTVRALPAPVGRNLVSWAGLVLSAILGLGLLFIYRLGIRQIRLARQQQDFISAVSHELKTPLTSIRMYGEMLREGWVEEPKRQEYYGFIHDEAERLSRLIANVLQLARMERNELQLNTEAIAAGALTDMLRSRVTQAIELTGFSYRVSLPSDCVELQIQVDPDAFTQIMINLIDNALKFSADAQRREIEIGVRRSGPHHVTWTVRDFGPGIPANEMKKIFELFYRPGSELTRETVGTGIGLALVRQLTEAMGGRIDVCNASPGAEFELRFPTSS